MPAVSGEAAEAKSLAFLAGYGAAFGLTRSTAQLLPAGSQTDIYGATHFSYSRCKTAYRFSAAILKPMWPPTAN